MLKHHWTTPQKPSRVCILGSQGFVASSVAKALNEREIAAEAIGSGDVNLTGSDAGKRLAARLRSEDTLIFVSARAPCKTMPLFMENLAMAKGVAEAIAQTTPAHLIYISSDAVYRDDLDLVREGDCAHPGSLHGAMHMAREALLQASTKIPLCLLRPSLLYGAADPHNGYGPNRFMRQAAVGETITLFGEGEEQRDHVWIRDVADIVCRVAEHRSQGILNIATGQSWSFRAIAEHVVSLFEKPTAIQGTPRQNPVTHRHYDITACLKAFPDFHYTSLKDGLAHTHRHGMKKL
ncbi:MAG: NAD-dependent epimerase/dehydratase family protein [Nitrospirae bacterium]|nr:NAD-dependent epimerase/dehydratase family protein [Magnetococcales bacterium]HAT50326.1 NAD-dependent dehydratase [Alphaproteobacteria bacterium]